MADIRDHRDSAQPRRINGKLPIKPGTYLQVTAPRHGPATLRPAVAALLPSAVLKARQPSRTAAVAAAAAPASQVAGTGNLPAGFGRQVPWTGDDDFAMVAILNTADDLGLCVTGVRDGDTYQHVAVSGHASFSTDTKNNGIAGLIGVIGVGADVAAGYFGVPEVTPFLDAATKYAQQQFPESEVPSKRRDGYGEDGSHHKARAEGGVIVCEPQAQGILYSADADHQSFWIKPDGTRDDNHLPRHIHPGDAFYLQRGMGPRKLSGTGDLFLCAWDWNFPDNAGFYEVHFILKRGDGDTNTPVG
jgi:hypothetical protein